MRILSSYIVVQFCNLCNFWCRKFRKMQKNVKKLQKNLEKVICSSYLCIGFLSSAMILTRLLRKMTFFSLNKDA